MTLPSPPAQPLPPHVDLRPLAGRRVLIADDDPVDRGIALRLLERLGCVAKVACDGGQAVEMHQVSGYDLILMDCEMPRLDGFGAAQRIRSLEGAASRTPIVALTRCCTPGDRDKCLTAGMDDLIPKPARMQVVMRVLARWLPPAADLRDVEGAGAQPAKDDCVDCGARSDELDAVREMFAADFPELAGLYLASNGARISELRNAGTAGDSVRLAGIAHALAGSSASIGAAGLAVLCRELELLAKAGALDDFEERMTAIETEYNHVNRRLQSMLQ